MLSTSQLLPKLQSTCTEPLYFLEKHFLLHDERIREWFEQQWGVTPPPVYGSVDLRNAGFKVAPIDMNLFPAGFNNLNPNFLSLSVQSAQSTIHRVVPGARKILIVPESHTRNMKYWENIQTLQTILMQAGFETRLGLLNGDENEVLPRELTLPSGGVVQLEALQREDGVLVVDQFKPDFVLLNNDLSEGIPEVLQGLKQPIIPPAELGWSQRLKSEHFQFYAEVAAEFAALVGIDPWLISPLFKQCGQIDFMQKDGMECLIANAEILFAEIKEKYAEYNISHQPFLIIKADAGTYGMAVMTVRNVDELRSLNRKQRTRMSTIKGGQPVRRVIIQEGVYTFETFGEDQAVAEPVVYLWGDQVVGGFYRVHQERGVDENLNAPGMHFAPIAFPQSCHEPCRRSEPDATQNRLFVYGIVAQLSVLAAAREMKRFST